MKTIAITGASGFIAQYLIPVLKRKYDVVGLVRSTEKGTALGIPYVVGDITDGRVLDDLFRGASCVIHLATISTSQDEALQHGVNVKGTQHVVRVARRQHVERLIHLSSLVVTRTVKDAYALSKVRAETIVRKGQVPYIVLRPPFVYGRGGYAFDRLVRLIQRVPVVTPLIGSGQQVVRPVYVRDLVSVIEQCVEMKNVNVELNLCGEPVTFSEFVCLVQDAIHQKKPVLKIPEWFVSFVLWWTDLLIPGKLPMSRKTIKRMNESVTEDDALARRLLHWSPRPHKQALAEIFSREL